MRKAEIKFSIELDENNVPETIKWEAEDKEPGTIDETKSVSVSLWDHESKNTLRIDLWTKDMPVEEMKKFYLDSLGGLAQSILNSTGDEYMHGEINSLCDKFIKYLEKRP